MTLEKSSQFQPGQIANPSWVVHFLLSGQAQLKLDVRFTDSLIGMFCKDIPSLKVVNIIFMANEKMGTTILEVEVHSKRMILKCVNTEIKMGTKKDDLQTYMQQEIESFQNIKDYTELFVSKYAHGRLFIIGTGYSCEFILMQKMCQTPVGFSIYNHRDKTTKFQWWIEGIRKLISVHRAGFAHGDSHLDNLLWEDGVGMGEMKWIDMERMVNIKTCSQQKKNALILQDIYHILMHNSYFASLVDPSNNANIVIPGMNIENLHRRLLLIEGESKDNRLFHLPDIIIFSEYFRKSIINDDLMVTLQHSNPTQLHRMSAFKTFEPILIKLTNLEYLEKVITYLAKQCWKGMHNQFDVSHEDLNFPILNDPLPTPRRDRVHQGDTKGAGSQMSWQDLLAKCDKYPVKMYQIYQQCDIITKPGHPDKQLRASLMIFDLGEGMKPTTKVGIVEALENLSKLRKTLIMEFHTDKVTAWCREQKVSNFVGDFKGIFTSVTQTINEAYEIVKTWLTSDESYRNKGNEDTVPNRQTSRPPTPQQAQLPNNRPIQVSETEVCYPLMYANAQNHNPRNIMMNQGVPLFYKFNVNGKCSYFAFQNNNLYTVQNPSTGAPYDSAVAMPLLTSHDGATNIMQEQMNGEGLSFCVQGREMFIFGVSGTVYSQHNLLKFPLFKT